MLADISEWQIANIHAMDHQRSGDSKDVCCVIRTELLILGEDSNTLSLKEMAECGLK